MFVSMINLVWVLKGGLMYDWLFFEHAFKLINGEKWRILKCYLIFLNWCLPI